MKKLLVASFGVIFLSSPVFATELMCAGVITSPLKFKGVPTSVRMGSYPGKVTCPTGCTIKGEFFYIGPMEEVGHKIFSPNTQSHDGYEVFSNGDVVAEEPSYSSSGKSNKVKLGFENSYMPSYFEYISESGQVVRSENVSCRIW